MTPLVFLARRYLVSRRRHRRVGAPLLSLIGLAVGVLALNGVLAVMNGFQLTFIESLIELSSSHLRWTPSDGAVHTAQAAAVSLVPGVRSVVATTEGQTLVESSPGNRRGAILRGFAPNALTTDASLALRLGLAPGALGGRGLPEPGQVVLGSELARALGVIAGDRVKLTSLSGAEFSLLKPSLLEFTVKGTFTTGYYEIDAGWVLANLDDALASFAGPGDFFYAVKLLDGNADLDAAKHLRALVGHPSEVTTWRDYNAAFFGALRTEKAVMMVLVGLIFFVVGVNIYFSQRRAVAEHREDLALWAAVGVRRSRLRLVFALEGLVVGVLAAAVGTVLGLGAAWSFGSLDLLSSEAFYLPALPARVLAPEVALIAFACIASSTAAAWLASAGVTRIPVAEVLRS